MQFVRAYLMGRLSRFASIFVLALVVLSVFCAVPEAYAAGGGLAGVITSASTGNPVPNVRVTAWRYTGAGVWSSSGGIATTGADGAYSITVPAAGKYRLMFVDPSGDFLIEYYHNAIGLAESQTIEVAQGEFVTGLNESLSTPAGRVNIRIENEAGDPINGGIWGVLRRYSGTGSWADIPALALASAGAGNYTVQGVPPGLYQLRAVGYSTGYGSAIYSASPGGAPTSFRVKAGQTVQLNDMVLAPATTAVSVTVVNDTTGLPIQGMRVYASVVSPATQDSDFLTAVLTNAQGASTFTGLAAGSYQFRVKDPGEVYGSVTVDAVITESPEPITVRVTTGGIMTGTITGPTGEPVVGASVQACFLRPPKTPVVSSASVTGVDGSYVISGLKAGDYRVLVTDAAPLASEVFDGAPGTPTASAGTIFRVTAGETLSNINVQLESASVVTGTVTNTTDSGPVEGASVLPYTLVGGVWRPALRYPVFTDSDGRYVINDLFPGTYRIRVYDERETFGDRYYPSYSKIERATNVTVVAGEAKENVNVRVRGVAAGEVTKTVAAGSGTSAVAQLDGSGTVAFADAGSDSGTVSIRPISILDRGAPANFEVLGEPISVSTTTSYEGAITISLPYDPAVVTGDASALKLFHYVDGGWVDVTTAVDTVEHTVTGVTTSLSPFGLMAPPEALSGESGGSGGSGGESGSGTVSVPAYSAWSLLVLVLAGAGLAIRRRNLGASLANSSNG